MSMRPNEIPDKEKLIAALRSGEYRQIKGRASDKRGGYCAIGLAAALGIRLTDDQVATLIFWNDEIGLSFSEIAARLENGNWRVVRPTWEEVYHLIRFGDYDGLPYEVQSAPDHDPIEAHIRTLRALAANPLDARSHARSGPTAAHKIL